ncbi:hypothetical protein ACS0PU_001774 [Formica fusca]
MPTSQWTPSTSSGIPFHVGPGTPRPSVSPFPLPAGPQENRTAWSRPRDRQVKSVYATLPYTKHTRRKVSYGSRT